MNIGTLLGTLREHQANVSTVISSLEKLESLDTPNTPAPTTTARVSPKAPPATAHDRGRRKMSPETRKRISESLKARNAASKKAA